MNNFIIFIVYVTVLNIVTVTIRKLFYILNIYNQAILSRNSRQPERDEKLDKLFFFAIINARVLGKM